jgi:hypothetical protein
LSMVVPVTGATCGICVVGVVCVAELAMPSIAVLFIQGVLCLHTAGAH